MSVEPDRAPRASSFSKLAGAKRDEAKRRFLATTPGERVEAALRMSTLAAEMRAGLRKRQ